MLHLQFIITLKIEKIYINIHNVVIVFRVLTYLLHSVWHIRLAQDLARPLCLVFSLLLCHMSTQQPSVLLPLFIAMLFLACLFFCFLLASRLALFLLAGRSSCRHDQAMPTFFRMRQMCCCFVAWLSLVLEMVSGQYTFSIFLRQVLWKLESLLVSCVLPQHSEP